MAFDSNARAREHTMLTIKINGEPAALRIEDLPRLSDVVELIKATIDPEHIITGIIIDGRELEEAEWNAPPSRFASSTLEIETGTAYSFVAKRLKTSPEVVSSCYVEFREARKLFQAGDMHTGNRRLVQAVRTLEAFVSWYATLLDLVPAGQRAPLDINPHIEKIGETCNKICEQQRYQSWWAISESIKNDLEPQLDALEDFCRRISY